MFPCRSRAIGSDVLMTSNHNEGENVKYVILIHASPQPWGHPVEDFLPEHQQMPVEERERHQAAFESLLGTLYEQGELVGGEALGNPEASKIYRWEDGAATKADGPYAETKEHLAGFFVIDVKDRDRADRVAAQFGGPGQTIELRPLIDGDDAA
jgi:hypothetical protein